MCPNGTVSYHTAPTPGPSLIPSPKQHQPVKIRNHRAVASHNRTAISYLYVLQKLVTFSGLPHFKNESQFFVTQTHHPIPALAHKEYGVKASRNGPVTQDYPGSRQADHERDESSPGPAEKVEHSNCNAHFAQTEIMLP